MAGLLVSIGARALPFLAKAGQFALRSGAVQKGLAFAKGTFSKFLGTSAGKASVSAFGQAKNYGALALDKGKYYGNLGVDKFKASQFGQNAINLGNQARDKGSLFLAEHPGLNNALGKVGLNSKRGLALNAGLMTAPSLLSSGGASYPVSHAIPVRPSFNPAMTSYLN